MELPASQVFNAIYPDAFSVDPPSYYDVYDEEFVPETPPPTPSNRRRLAQGPSMFSQDYVDAILFDEAKLKDRIKALEERIAELEEREDDLMHECNALMFKCSELRRQLGE